MSNFSDYFDTLTKKLYRSSYITDSANIIFGEYPDIQALADSFFPRVEVLLTKCKCNGYVDQRNMSWSLRYGVAGYMRRTNASELMLTATEMGDIINFGKEICDLNYEFLDDKQEGEPPCDGFMMLGEFPEIFAEFELFPKISAFVFEMEAILYLADTEVVA